MKEMFKVPELGAKVPRDGGRFTHWLGKRFLKSTGWCFSGEFPNCSKMIIAVAPHTSNWDFFIGLAVKFCFKLKIQFLGKHTIFVPIIGKLLRYWGGIPVERSKAHGVVNQLTEIFAKQNELVLCLSPEGTRKRIDQWKTGFVQIARHARVPVLLVGFDYQVKKIKIGPLVSVGDDIEVAMEKIYRFFSNVSAKYPESFYIPEIYLTHNKTEKKVDN
ncbi:acyltransferase [Alteromonadaceae bacterium M269]|nr:acyltransferase [Alteromonadaceae bacterium M269]